jgi:import inner membrane translocase subunit TIM54
MNQTRPINVPVTAASEFAEPSNEGGISQTETKQDLGDLDFDLDKERLFKSSLEKIPEETEKARKEFYEKLPERLATARALSRGTREPTKDEISNPPPTEVELRAERMKKELRWRRDVDGWNLIKPSTPVVWDERFRDALRVFTDPSEH